MAHTYTQNLVHLVFSTKNRLPLIPNEKQAELWKYIVGIGANHKIRIISGGGMRDHVHVLFDLPKTMPLAKAAQTIKANSSRWMRETDRRFAWQESYGAFGVSESLRDVTIAYIVDQPQHHKRRDFKAEYVAFLKKYNIERYPVPLPWAGYLIACLRHFLRGFHPRCRVERPHLFENAGFV